MGPFEQQVETNYPTARKIVCRTLATDKEMHRAYHDNVAMTIYDNSKLSQKDSNVAAAAVMGHIFRENDDMGPFEKHVNARFEADTVNTPDFPRRYVEYIAHTEGCDLKEAARRSLSRIFRIFTEPKRNVAILTAFRDDYTLPENRQRNRQLMADIRRLGYGFVPVIGGWIEKQDSGEFRPVEEESIVVSGPMVERVFTDGPVEAPGREAGLQFQANIHKLVRKYDQDGALLKLSGSKSAIILEKSGNTFSLGPWSLNKAAENYTKMRGGGQKGRKFAFEAAGNESSTTRQSVKRFFEDRVTLAEQGFALRPNLSTGTPQAASGEGLWMGVLYVSFDDKAGLDAALAHVRSHPDVVSATPAQADVSAGAGVEGEVEIKVELRATSDDAARGKIIELTKV